MLFVIGLIVGLLIAGPVVLLVLGLCNKLTLAHDAMDSALQKLEAEARERVHITGGSK